MSYFINDNNFARDNYPKRMTRLGLLSRAAPKYAVELSISGDMLTWAMNAHPIFMEQSSKDTITSGEKDVAYQTFQESFNILTKRYQILKDLLISRYADDESKLLIFGISGQTPRTIPEIIQSSEMLTGANTKLKDSGDTNVLPDSMILEFQNQIDDAKEKYFLAGMQRDEATQENKKLRELFDADTKRLKAIYSWIVTFWSKDENKLIEFGFDQVKPRSGRRGPLAPTNIAFDSVTNFVRWDESENATSYQLVIADAESLKTRWQKYYSGEKNEVIIDSKFTRTKIKVRARSANGFGKWSEEIALNYGL